MAVEEPTSNPLPPPPPRRRNDGAGSVRQENLSNADFRRMVIETPRRVEDPKERPKKKKEKDDEGAKRSQRKHRPKPKEEEKEPEELDQPRYRDRAKERREEQNPDYDLVAAGLGTLHAVAPPGAVDLHAADVQKISIANSKYLGGDVEHTHLVKGLDYALLNKVRSEIDKKPEDAELDGKTSVWKEDEPVTFRTAAGKVVHQWIVKPQTMNKINEMFLPCRMAFVYDMEEVSHHIPTTVHRSKDDCPVPEEFVTVGVDATVLDRIAKIMAYLKLGSSGKVLKKKKKEKSDARAKGASFAPNEDILEPKAEAFDEEKGTVSMAPPPQDRNEQEHEELPKARIADDEIFEGAGTEYVATVNNANESPVSEDMEESPRDGHSYFQEGPLPQQVANEWQQSGYGPVQGPVMPQFAADWQDYPAPPSEPYSGPWPPEYPYPEQYYPNQVAEHGVEAPGPPSSIETVPPKDPRFMTQEEKDRGMGSVFKRDDQRLQQRRELDAREKDPSFISESYSECYPGYQEYHREIVDSDEEEDLTKMDMGGRAKGRLHRWDFETEEDWAKYNDQKEAMPKAAFQFGVKMQDGRKTRKQNKDQKLNNDLHKITQILEKKKKDRGGSSYDDGGNQEEESHPGKRLRV